MAQSDWQEALRSMLPEGYNADTAPEAPAAEPPRPALRIELDRKRAGKTATIVSGFEPGDPRAAELAAELRRLCACGGSSRGGEILLQGDRVAAVRAHLASKGYKCR